MHPEDQAKFRRWKLGLVLRALLLVLFIGAMIGVFALTMDSMGYSGYIGIIVGLFAGAIFFAIIIGIHAGRRRKLMAAARFGPH